MQRRQFKTVDEYINSFPKELSEKLQTIRKLISSVAPQADQVISYNIPTFKINGKYLIYFAGFEKHIGLYPFSAAMKLTKAEITKYKKGRGTLQFPNDEKLPLALIKRIAKNLLKDKMSKS